MIAWMIRSHRPTVNASRVIPPHCGSSTQRTVPEYDSYVENVSDPATARALTCSSQDTDASAIVFAPVSPRNEDELSASTLRRRSIRAASSVAATATI
ncbi:hypothetical protein [Leucobacter chromiisoli]|uniref:hypothetical protein n=1 Tax=Leucobacter chromiisoli TaxID=2796471 RepID=UPI001F3B3B70|nr:hypothetical protein [Leucobacter chromiisoli]